MPARLNAILCAIVVVIPSAGIAAPLSFKPVLFFGDDAPGIPGATFQVIQPPSINDSGDIAFRATLGSATGVTEQNNDVIYRNTTLIAREGDVAPGTGGLRFESDFGMIPFTAPPRIGDDGKTAFFSALNAPRGSAIFVDDVPNFLSGTEIAGPDGGLILGGGDFARNYQGEIVARIQIEDSPEPLLSRFTISSPDAVLASARQPAPGLGDSFLASIDSPELTNGGQLFFRAQTSNPASLGIFSLSDLIVEVGDPAPELGGLTLTNFFRIGANDEDVFFSAVLDGPGVDDGNDTALFSTSELIAREGDRIPGAGDSDVSFGDQFVGFAVNDRGQVVFNAGLSGSDAAPGSRALYLWEADTGLQEIFRIGDIFDVEGVGEKTLAGFSFFAEGGLSDVGGIALQARFNDGTTAVGVIDDLSPSAIPLPTSLTLLLAGLAMFGALKRSADI